MKTIKQAFNAGMEAFAKHCLQYGTITHDKNYIDMCGKECRRYRFNIQGVTASITKRTGEVIATSYTEVH